MIPLFKSDRSISRSILTLDDETEKDGPDSIFTIAEENKLEELYLVEDGMTGFLTAYEGCQKRKIPLRFGLRLTFVNDLDSPECENTWHKNVIFAKNTEGCSDLMKIWSDAATKLSGKFPRVDYKYIKTAWTKNLHLAIPFYDSFLFRNRLSFSNCIPDFSFTEPTILKERNGLPFEGLIHESLKSFDYPTMDVKSIYYKNREDFDAYTTFRIVGRRSFGKQATLECPNMDHFHSDNFCFESWKESL